MSGTPKADEVEVTVLGPGRGESVVVHLGGGEWLVADCCVTRKGGAAPLAYLESIGVSPDHVAWVVATHWHDDHVRGFGELVRTCAKARVVQAVALEADEFITLVAAGDDLGVSGTTGVREMSRTVEALIESDRGWPEFVRADQRLELRAETASSPGFELWALSPSNEAVIEAIRGFESLAPRAGSPRRTIPRPDRNLVAVVLHLRVGAMCLLLGADLEAHGSPAQGWQAIVQSVGRPSAPAHFLKVPHHGSRNAHDPDVWAHLLITEPHAALTPFRSGATPLPRPTDAERIARLTPNAWLTRFTDASGSPKRPRAVERTIREAARSIEVVSVEPGRVTMRCPADGSGDWMVDAPNPATRLSA